jgi:hypothetical protein
MITTRRLRELEVSAASGLVVVADRLCVVGDDELDLWIYSGMGERLLSRVRLLEGVLPLDRAARKAEKPDLESIGVLPSAGLLALGSGSRPSRMRGVWLPEGMEGTIQVVDLRPLYHHLAAELAELNIEGMAVSAGMMRLLQRGNGAAGENAVVDLDLQVVRTALAADRRLPAEAVLAIRRLDLGRHAGAPWSFTDASPLPDGGLLFSAAAEDTRDVYEDGPCLGAALGVLSPEGVVVKMEPLDVTVKVEGIHVLPSGDVLLVGDPDEPGTPSPLLLARWPER